MEMTNVRRWLSAGLLAVIVSLVVAVAVLSSGRTEVRAALATVNGQLAERDAELVRLRAELAESMATVGELRDASTEAADLREEIDRLRADVDRFEEETADLREQLVDAEEAVVLARAAPPAPDSRAAPADPPPSPAPVTPDPCDTLGIGHENGSAWCADVLQSIEDCEREIAADPDWVRFDGALYEHVVTGDVTSCDF
jgi:hypothetical protein